MRYRWKCTGLTLEQHKAKDDGIAFFRYWWRVAPMLVPFSFFGSKYNDPACHFPTEHRIIGLIDLIQGIFPRNQFIQFQLTRHI